MARMWRYWLLYVAAAAILVGVFVAASMLPIPEFSKGLLSLSAVGAMLSFLGQLWRDQLDYERRLALQMAQQDFSLGIASHMASVPYNKHFEFAEAYSQKVDEGLNELAKRGASDTYALQLAADLSAIRSKYTVWLSEEIEQQLFRYEYALGTLGANIGLMTHTQSCEGRERIARNIVDPFLLVTGSKAPDSEEEAKKTAGRAREHLRTLLGIRELTALRDTAIAAAKKRMPSGG